MLHVQICFLLIRRKSVLHVQFVFLLIRSISLEDTDFHCRPRLALHDLIFFFLTDVSNYCEEGKIKLLIQTFI